MRTGAASRRPPGKIYAWDGKSTYVKNPPYFDGMTMTPAAVGDIKGARALAVLGDSVTTDHISPAGNISEVEPGGASTSSSRASRPRISIPTARGAATMK